MFMHKLGLFWRGALIKEMACDLIKYHNGAVPSEKSHLKKIPGIGDYIADAVAVFAFNAKRTVVDANVVRLVSRFFGIEIAGELRRNRKFVDFCQTISNNLDTSEIKSLNWAMIDHSSAICRPAPLCGVCPLAKKCNYLNKCINNNN